MPTLTARARWRSRSRRLNPTRTPPSFFSSCARARAELRLEKAPVRDLRALVQLRCALGRDAFTGGALALLSSLTLCGPARATTYFRSSATAQTGSGASSIAISAPAGRVAGDIMVAAIDAEGSGTVTAPSGWSSTGLFANTTAVGFKGVYFHVAGSSEPASYTWELGSSRKAVGKIADYVGVENSSPIEVTA